jgi:hypothetical protein
MKHKDPPKFSLAVVRVRFTLGPRPRDSRTVTKAEVDTKKPLTIMLCTAADW